MARLEQSAASRRRDDARGADAVCQARASRQPPKLQQLALHHPQDFPDDGPREAGLELIRAQPPTPSFDGTPVSSSATTRRRLQPVARGRRRRSRAPAFHFPRGLPRFDHPQDGAAREFVHACSQPARNVTIGATALVLRSRSMARPSSARSTTGGAMRTIEDFPQLREARLSCRRPITIPAARCASRSELRSNKRHSRHWFLQPHRLQRQAVHVLGHQSRARQPTTVEMAKLCYRRRLPSTATPAS